MTGNKTTAVFNPDKEYGYMQDEEFIHTYGRLYNWAAVADGRGLAPKGWHVPSLDEWKTLEDFIGDTLPGIHLKEPGFLHWKKYAYFEGTNETGFTALPAGCRWCYSGESTYDHLTIEGSWWTTTEDPDNPDFARDITMGYNYEMLGGCFCPKGAARSVRCVKN